MTRVDDRISTDEPQKREMSEIPRNRAQRRGALALVAIVGLAGASCASSATANGSGLGAASACWRCSPVTAAATGTSDASASRALRGSVTIVVVGKPLGPKTVAARGRFRMSGAISDRGKFVDRPGRDIWFRTLVGSKGTIWITLGEPVPASPCQCKWRITRATKGYAGLRGRGTESGRYTSSSVAVTMSGSVWQRPARG